MTYVIQLIKNSHLFFYVTHSIFYYKKWILKQLSVAKSQNILKKLNQTLKTKKRKLEIYKIDKLKKDHIINIKVMESNAKALIKKIGKN